MTTSDWVLLAFLGLSLLYGWRQGTINVAGQAGAWVLGYLAARNYSALAADYAVRAFPKLQPEQPSELAERLDAFLRLFFDTETLTNRLLQAVAAILIFLIVSWLVRTVAYGLTSVFCRGLLGRLNRALGAALALALGSLLLLVLALLVFPYLAGLGMPEPQAFMDRSQIVLPYVLQWQPLL